MTRIFDRSIRIQIQDRLIEGLAVKFRVDKSLSDNPNTADLTIINLQNNNSRSFLHGLQIPVVQINAGYLGRDPTNPAGNQPGSATSTTPGLVFLGQMRELTNLREGTDWLTRLHTGDGDEALHTPVNFALGPGTSLQTAVKKVISDMGVGVGNAFTALAKGEFSEAGTQFINGMVSDGLGKDELKRLMRSAGLEASVQNGQIQAMPIGQPVNNTAVVLKSNTGLIGSPELGKDKKTKEPVATFRTLLTTQIFPGAKVKIESEAVSGFFRVERVVYSGHTHQVDWYCDCEATGLS